jgi:lipopolysaccharide cholinephosphotransferase
MGGMHTMQEDLKNVFSTRFPDLRESGETPLRQCQLVMLRMLRIFDYICRKHDIPYWLSDGTLLGAVRHQGFIPWDGDVDVGMLREDFDRFAAIAPHMLPEDIFFQTPETDPACESHPQFKLRDRYSCYTEWAAAYPEYQWHHGLMVDIWPSNLVPSRALAITRNISAFCRRKFDAVVHGNYPFFLYSLAYDDVFPLQYFQFEGHQFPGLNHTASYLCFHYGNYMKLPPVGKRRCHHGVADAFTPCGHPASLDWSKRG